MAAAPWPLMTFLNALRTSIWVVTSRAGGRLVEYQQVRPAAQRHRRHQALELTAGHLVRVAPAEAIRIGQLQGGVKLLRPPVGRLLVEEAVQHRRLGDLLADGEGRVEGGGGALREVGDPPAAQHAPILGRHGEHVAPVEPHLAARELEPRLGVAEGGEGDGGLAGAGFADERHHLAACDLEAHPLDDRNHLAELGLSVDPEAVDLQQGHYTILFASFPPACAETSSTIRLMEMVRVAMAMAGAIGASDP